MSGKVKAAVVASALVLITVILSCSEDSNYDQRTVVYVSSINKDAPFLCDVLCQGDSIYEKDQIHYKYSDDFVTEDWIQVVFTNKPYNSIVDPDKGSLGDFLVTGYDVEFIPYGGAPVPVQPFSGTTSVLVPSGTAVPASILLVPFAAKNVNPLLSLMYTNNEIMARAHITFHGQEVQTNNNIKFEVNVTVDFADPLVTKADEKTLNP
jgi:hypothetical protein